MLEAMLFSPSVSVNLTTALSRRTAHIALISDAPSLS
ncbi:uncharacterized protein METZ01_LOCUS1430 [marine metagenome]|uniref:Uncharacterized protein n=1 Tax=marine metagenome TaxID=408172 RepID=A0A381N1W7_9ZZZZ